MTVRMRPWNFSSRIRDLLLPAIRSTDAVSVPNGIADISAEWKTY